MAIDYNGLKLQLAKDEFQDPFETVAEVAAFVASASSETESRDIIIRTLARASELRGQRAVIFALARAGGLFAYLPSVSGDGDLQFRDALALEIHKPQGLGSVIFNTVQNQVYRKLMDGQNVILSAPTSFGKSLILDSILTSGLYETVVAIVPTIALIDETRRRLSILKTHRVVTHPTQTVQGACVLVMTQERYLAFPELPKVDFFFIDEFYKLGEKEKDGKLTARASLLNQALLKLMRTGSQYYMAGPSIESLDNAIPTNFRGSFIRTDFSTVAVDVTTLKATNIDQRLDRIVEILRTKPGPTIIYCQSPGRVRVVLARLILENLELDVPGMVDDAGWVKSNYHPDWSLGVAMSLGVGAHHGRLPRWLSQRQVQGFNEGKLGVLVCTNSLIEGVNTRAKNIIVLDKNIATQAYDYFTFANIRGRAGRMFKHFVGNVFLFHEPPKGDLPDVDMPGLSQSDAAPSSLLISLPEKDRTDAAAGRIGPLLKQNILSVATLRNNPAIEPERQLQLALELRQRAPSSLDEVRWSGAFPSVAQMRAVNLLIWDFLLPPGAMNHGAVSERQLSRFVNVAAFSQGLMREIVGDFTANSKWWRTGETLDDRIETAFDSMRFWVGHHLPVLYRAVESIVNEVPGSISRSADYSSFVARMENGFRRPLFQTLEEYGVPCEVTEKLVEQGREFDDLDTLLRYVRARVDQVTDGLTEYERRLVREAFPLAETDPE